jgi:hypothetical protein
MAASSAWRCVCLHYHTDTIGPVTVTAMAVHHPSHQQVVLLTLMLAE